MRFKLPRKWNVFAHGRPGHRFQDRYHAHQRDRAEHGLGRRLLRLILALVAAAVGVVLVFIPGPAIVFFFLAGALLAVDWLWMARTLDWTEVRLRKLFHWVERRWKQLPTGGRTAVVAMGACLSGIVMYGTYRMMR